MRWRAQRWTLVWAAAAVCVAQIFLQTTTGLAQTREVPGSKAEISLSFAPLVREVGPAVVNVYTRTVVTERRRLTPMFDDPFFKQFFDNMFPQLPQRRREAASLGSGVIVDPDGTIITNNHVIDGADEITVVLNDRREFKARLVLADPDTDLAVLAIEGLNEELPYVRFRDSDDLEVGDLVLAIGNPFGVGQTVTMGIVSALARTNVGITDYSFFIQTDASINPGNSGGALIGTDGRLVGINTAIFSNSRGRNGAGSVGIGFAVPANMVATVLRAARDGEVIRPWIGARTQTVTAELAEGLSLARPVGALVSDIYPGGPSEAAGLRAGDVIVAVDGRPVLDNGGLRYRIATRAPGETVLVRVLRRGREFDLAVDMIAPIEDPPADVTDLKGRHPFSGSRVANLSPALAVDVGFDDFARGVVVLGLRQGSPASRVNLRPGDIVLELNGRDIDSVDSLERALAGAGDAWDFRVRRDGKVIPYRLRR